MGSRSGVRECSRATHGTEGISAKRSRERRKEEAWIMSWADESEGALPRIPHAFGAFGSVGQQNSGGLKGFAPPGGFANAASSGPPGIFTSGNPVGPPGGGLSFGTGIGNGEREPPNYAFGSPGQNNGANHGWGAPGGGLGMNQRAAPGFGAPGGPVGGARSAVGVGAPGAVGGAVGGRPFGAVGAPIGPQSMGSPSGGFPGPPSGFNGNNMPGSPPGMYQGETQLQPPRPVLPMPSAPPFTAFVGNFPYECSQDEVVGLFSANACAIADVRMVRNRDTDRPRGYFLEFEDLPSLQRALTFDTYILGGRPLRVNVAEGRPERRDRDRDRFGSGGGFAERYNNDRGRGGFDRNGGGFAERYNEGGGPPMGMNGGFGGPGGQFVGGGASFGRREGGGGYQEAREGRGGRIRDGPDVQQRRRSFDRPADRVPLTDGPAPEGRKKLVLAARSVPTDGGADGGATATDASSAPSSKPNPFGGARPVDSTAKIAEAERKIKEEKEAIHLKAGVGAGLNPETGLPAPKPHAKVLSKSAVQPPVVGRRGPLIMASKEEPAVTAQNAFAMLAMSDGEGDDDDEE